MFTKQRPARRRVLFLMNLPLFPHVDLDVGEAITKDPWMPLPLKPGSGAQSPRPGPAQPGGATVPPSGAWDHFADGSPMQLLTKLVR